MAAALISFGTPLFVILVALFLVAGAYAIAMGASERRAEDLSPIERDRAWANGVLARPLWLEAAATAAEYLALGITLIALLASESPRGLSPWIAAIIAMAPVAGAFAFAMTAWERRSARQTLRTLPQ